MTGILQLTEQLNPSAQTFVVGEPGGTVLTAVGLFFASASSTIPVTVELRPCGETGAPSAKRFIPGSRVSVAGSTVSSNANTTYADAVETKFNFREPIYVPQNTLMSLVVYTAAPAGDYKIWVAQNGKFLTTSSTEFYNAILETGAFYQSSNGTSWQPDNNKDLTFKVYRAEFQYQKAFATLHADTPPVKRLTENVSTDNITRYPSDPLIFTLGSNHLRILHPAHGYQIGDKVTLSTYTDGFDSSSTINGVKGSSILGARTIDSADAYGYSVRMDSAADSSVRAGGTGLLASEQYVIDEFTAIIPNSTPPKTSLTSNGDFVSNSKGLTFAGAGTSYTQTSNVSINLNAPQIFKNPHTLLNTEQETNKNSGNASAVIRVNFETQNKYVAPYINVNAAFLQTVSNFVDFPDSDNAGHGFTNSLSTLQTNRNRVTTIDYVNDSAPNGGTATGAHISIVYRLEDDATSLRILFSGSRPIGTDFTVWYRTNTNGDGLIFEKSWRAFSKSKNAPNSSNYNDIGNTIAFRQFEFNQYDLPLFNEYQIKITFASSKSTLRPKVKSLRTIATV